MEALSFEVIQWRTITENKTGEAVLILLFERGKRTNCRGCST